MKKFVPKHKKKGFISSQKKNMLNMNLRDKDKEIDSKLLPEKTNHLSRFGQEHVTAINLLYADENTRAGNALVPAKETGKSSHAHTWSWIAPCIERLWN